MKAGKHQFKKWKKVKNILSKIKFIGGIHIFHSKKLCQVMSIDFYSFPRGGRNRHFIHTLFWRCIFNDVHTEGNEICDRSWQRVRFIPSYRKPILILSNGYLFILPASTLNFTARSSRWATFLLLPIFLLDSRMAFNVALPMVLSTIGKTIKLRDGGRKCKKKRGEDDKEDQGRWIKKWKWSVKRNELYYEMILKLYIKEKKEINEASTLIR